MILAVENEEEEKISIVVVGGAKLADYTSTFEEVKLNSTDYTFSYMRAGVAAPMCRIRCGRFGRWTSSVITRYGQKLTVNGQPIERFERRDVTPHDANTNKENNIRRRTRPTTRDIEKRSTSPATQHTGEPLLRHVAPVEHVRSVRGRPPRRELLVPVEDRRDAAVLPR